MNYNRIVIKQEVRQTIRQTRPRPILVTLLYLVIAGTVASIISGGGNWLSSLLVNVLSPDFVKQFNALSQDLFNGLLESMQSGGEKSFEFVIESYSETFEQLMSQLWVVLLAASVPALAVSILITAWNGLMSVGYSGYCLDMSRNMNPGVGRIFSGFPRAGSVILSYILVAIFTFLWGLLFGLGLGLLNFIASLLMTINDALAIVSIILFVIAPILYTIALIWMVYRYAMVPFAIIDSQNRLSAMDAIRTSKALMKGRKGRFFVLRLSFIGWYLLEYLIAVVGVIITLLVTAGTAAMNAGVIEDILSSGRADPEQLLRMLTQMLIFALPVALLFYVAIFIVNLWLTPYRIGCEARFYTCAKDETQPILPDPYQPGPYGGQPDPYQSGPYGGSSYGYHPDQGAYGGYPQGVQPPQSGAGTYTQWSAPQIPESPVFSSTEPLGTPESMTTPLFAEPPSVTVVLKEPDIVPQETPPAEPAAPGGDTPQQPDDPDNPPY